MLRLVVGSPFCGIGPIKPWEALALEGESSVGEVDCVEDCKMVESCVTFAMSTSSISVDVGCNLSSCGNVSDAA